jgi:hypothetical protein
VPGLNQAELDFGDASQTPPHESRRVVVRASRIDTFNAYLELLYQRSQNAGKPPKTVIINLKTDQP